MSRFGHHSSGSKPASSSRHHFQAIAFDPNRQDRSSRPRLRETRFPAQSTFCRDRSPSPICAHSRERSWWEPSDSMPGMIPRLCVTRGPFRPYLRSDASSTLRHFLRARHSLGSHSLEYAPEGCQEPSVRRLPPKSLSICTRALVARFHSGSHPTSSRDSSVHADQARFGGTARTSRKVLACVLRGDRHL